MKYAAAAIPLLLAGAALAQAPAQPAPAAAPPAAAPAAAAPAGAPAQDAVASMLKVYVFPANNQTPDQQAKDSNDCYAWAKQQSGVDPAAPANPSAWKPVPPPSSKTGADESPTLGTRQE